MADTGGTGDQLRPGIASSRRERTCRARAQTRPAVYRAERRTAGEGKLEKPERKLGPCFPVGADVYSLNAALRNGAHLDVEHGQIEVSRNIVVAVLVPSLLDLDFG